MNWPCRFQVVYPVFSCWVSNVNAVLSGIWALHCDGLHICVSLVQGLLWGLVDNAIHLHFGYQHFGI